VVRGIKPSTPRAPVDPIWVWNHAQLYGRPVELTYDRYVEAMKLRPANTLDSIVELHLWVRSMRMLWRIASAAQSLRLPAVDAAVADFKREVHLKDLIALRDIFEHIDDYHVGLGRHKGLFPSAHMDSWTQAAQRLRAELWNVGRPRSLTISDQSLPRASSRMRRARFPTEA
jgi:hypothetical protein